MTYSSPFVYTRILGTLGNVSTGVEQWGVGFKIPLGVAPSPATLTAFLQTISPAVVTFHTGSPIAVGTNVYAKQLTAAYIGTNGRYVGGGTQATTIYDIPSTPAGAGTPTQPFSTAMVISLRTQFSRGLASNGRIYYPSLGSAVTATTGLWVSTVGTAWASAAKTLLDNINAAAASILNTSNRVSVMSNVGAGQTAPVTSIRCGLKPDRQERREKRLGENYQTAQLASTAALLASVRDLPIGQNA